MVLTPPLRSAGNDNDARDGGDGRVRGTDGRQRYKIFFPSAYDPEGAAFWCKKPE